MTNLIPKSSFTLPANEASLVTHLKKKLKLKSNTQVIRLALQELKTKLNRHDLRKQFQNASAIVSKDYEIEKIELDHLAGEGLS